jgi:hypothetical protein
MSTTVDTRPQNERQARALTANGRPRQTTEDDDPIMEAMEELSDAYERRPLSERREFIYWIRVLLADLEAALERKEARCTGRILKTNPNYAANSVPTTFEI